MTTTNTKAAQFINFFPGNTQDERSITIDAQAGYAVEDLEGLVKSVIAGCTSSCHIAADGEDGDLVSLIAALEDGAVLADWFGSEESEDETEEQRAQREAVEEVHAALAGHKRSLNA